MDKSKIYLDLSKCTEEEIIKIYHVLNDKNENIYHSDRMILKKGKFEKRFPYLTLNSGYTQWMSTFVNIHGKTELTYPQFLEMMGGKKSTEIETFTLEDLISFGKQCFYSGFEKSEKNDANCFTAWREEASGLLTKFKSNQ